MRLKTVIVAVLVIAAATFFVANDVNAESPFLVLDLLKSTENFEKTYNCEMKKSLSQLYLPNSTNHAISKFENFRKMFCLCYEEPKAGLNRKSRMGTPLQMHFGGFSNHQCWRELDMYLVETLCESQATMINIEWAKFLDCDEDPKRRDCDQKFFDGMQMQAKESPSPSKCLQYVEAIKHFFPARNISHDYKLSYVSLSNVPFLQSEDYRCDCLYLLNIFEEGATKSCLSMKRELSALQYMYERCISGRVDSDCDAILDKVEDTNCKSLLIPRKFDISGRGDSDCDAILDKVAESNCKSLLIPREFVSREEGKSITALVLSIINTVIIIILLTLVFLWCCGEQCRQKLCKSCLSISEFCDAKVKAWELQDALRQEHPINPDAQQDPINRGNAHNHAEAAPLQVIPIPPEAVRNPEEYPEIAPEVNTNNQGEQINEDQDLARNDIEPRPVNLVEPNLKFGECFKKMYRSVGEMFKALPIKRWARSFFSCDRYRMHNIRGEDILFV